MQESVWVVKGSGMDRDELIETLSRVLRDDDRVRGAWLSGSIGRGDADSYSDVDVWVAVCAPDRDAFIDDLPAIIDSTAPTVLNERVGTLPVFNAVTADWLRFDIVVGTVAEAVTRNHTAMKQLFDKDELHTRMHAVRQPQSPDPDSVTKLVKEFFRVLGLLPVVLGRREYALAVSGAGLLRTMAIQLMLQDVAVEDRGGALRIKPLLPAGRYEALESLPPLTADRDSVLAVHLACAQLFLPLAYDICDRLGFPWPYALEKACSAHWGRELGMPLPRSHG